METGQKELKTYLAHFGTKGQKHGLRRHQSYETAPTRSGMVGVEVGEAARQSDRLNRDNDRNDRNGPRRGPMQYEMQSKKPTYNSPEQLRKMSKKDILKAKLEEKKRAEIEKNKAEWAKTYKDLEKHKDAFTNKELEYALNRLNLTNRIKSDRWEQTRNLTQKGADTMKNLANASQSFVNIYNVVAGGYNTYKAYQDNKKNKVDLLPKWNSGSGTYNINNNNNQQHKKDDQKKPKTIRTRNGRFRGHANHSGMSATEYIAHFGIPGQKWWKRHFQSYKTAPTRSGKVGEEIGLAAKQAERLGEEEKPSDKPKNLDSYGLKGYNRNTASYSFGTYTDYRKDRNDKDGMFVRTTIDEEDDGSINKKSIDLMKHVEDNWDEIKKDVLNTYKKEIVDLYEAYEDMSHEDAVKAAEKAFSDPKNTDMNIRPIGDWDTLDIGIYNEELGWGDHLLSMEYDPYKKKKIGVGLGFDG